ncbi:MAG: hypothetical protein ABIA63_05200 [bacterium]
MLTAELNIASVEVTNVQSGRWTDSRSPYIVAGDIKVPHGASLVIEPGVQILFDGFYTIQIKGSLIAEGTPENPVVFTSIKEKQADPSGDNKSNAQPMDWNHIAVEQDGALKLINCRISYSFDVISSSSPEVFLDNLAITFNAVNKISVQEVEIPAETSIPFGYNNNLKETPVSVKTKPASAVSSEIFLTKKPQKKWYSNYWLWGGMAVSTGAAYSIILLNMKNNSSPPLIPDPPRPPN